MKFNCVELLEKEECLAIAKIIDGDGLSDDELLWCLPDYVFGKTLNVERVYNNFDVYDFDGKTKWVIPPYFVKKVTVKLI